MSRIAPAIPLSDLTEKQWDTQLFNSKEGLATSLGWHLVFHVLRMKGSQPGFPDRVLVRDRIIFAELKKETGKPTERQVAWLDGLSRAGAEAYLWRPSDLDEVGLILSQRWGFMRYREDRNGNPDVPPHLASIKRGWTPRSAWIPGRGRADTAGVAP